MKKRKIVSLHGLIEVGRIEVPPPIVYMIVPEGMGTGADGVPEMKGSLEGFVRLKALPLDIQRMLQNVVSNTSTKEQIVAGMSEATRYELKCAETQNAALGIDEELKGGPWNTKNEEQEAQREMLAAGHVGQIDGGVVATDAAVPEVEVESIRSLIGQMSAVMADIQAGKDRWRASALANERCPICPGPTFVGATWVGELRPNVGIVERLRCGCAAGHSWWAAVPKEQP